MIKDLKTGFKLMKYGAQFRYTMFSVVLIAVIGIGVEIATKGTNFVGCFYMLLLAVFPMQLVFSTDVSTMVQTTKMKRKIQITIPITMNAILMTAMYIIICGIRIYEVKNAETASEEALMINGLVLLGITSFLFLAYMGACFKKFAVSLIIFMVLFMGTYLPLEVFMMVYEKPLVSFPVAIIIGFVGIVLGLLAQYGLLRAFYKCEMSKYAFGSQIRKLMQ